ncbi:hypothetical protein GCM10028806_22220 [Spirosoma terrae]|uniref:Uncharacterized protein n=1 Tax=Spirosoma terrae TaxID=1968276 RepID=A0A6L9L1P3_9BACT|nr:hypothetical protein [Spirosoma terrae]NDU94464.1 hypothetical protein [Spirosoma terrae]
MKKMKEAEAVYWQDLVHNPGNGWSMVGLHKVLRLIETIKIIKGPSAEHLQVTFHSDNLLKDFLLTLKPEVSIIWGTTYE